MAGIALVVYVLVMALQFVVTDFVLVMKPMKHVQQIVMPQVSVMRISLSIVLMMIAAHYHGLVMALKIVKTNNMAVI
jgi:hypothetical protein